MPNYPAFRLNVSMFPRYIVAFGWTAPIGADYPDIRCFVPSFSLEFSNHNEACAAGDAWVSLQSDRIQADPS